MAKTRRIGWKHLLFVSAIAAGISPFLFLMWLNEYEMVPLGGERLAESIGCPCLAEGGFGSLIYRHDLDFGTAVYQGQLGADELTELLRCLGGVDAVEAPAEGAEIEVRYRCGRSEILISGQVGGEVRVFVR